MNLKFFMMLWKRRRVPMKRPSGCWLQGARLNWLQLSTATERLMALPSQRYTKRDTKSLYVLFSYHQSYDNNFLNMPSSDAVLYGLIFDVSYDCRNLWMKNLMSLRRHCTPQSVPSMIMLSTMKRFEVWTHIFSHCPIQSHCIFIKIIVLSISKNWPFRCYHNITWK